jgi:hypothetical protein
MVEIAGRLNALLGENAYPNKVRGCKERCIRSVSRDSFICRMSARLPAPGRRLATEFEADTWCRAITTGSLTIEFNNPPD